VIFKQCLMKDQPTLKASNSEDKITLPGRLQLFRGTDADGMYVGDVIGLESETVEIPGAVKVERLLVPFWENGQHSAIPSIEKQKAFVEEQHMVSSLQATVAQQQKQIEELSAGLQKVSAQVEMSKPAPETVVNNQ